MSVPMDWKSKRAVHPKVRDSKQKKKQRHDITVQMGQMEEYTLCWFTNGDFCKTSDWWVLSSRNVLLRHQLIHLNGLYLISWFDPSPMVTSPMKIAECLYCNVGPPPILLVQSCFVNFTCYIQSQSHIVIQLYIHTFI